MKPLSNPATFDGAVIRGKKWLLLLLAIAGIAPELEAVPPNTIYWEADRLASLRQMAGEVSANVEQSLSALRLDAEAALKRGPYSVVEKDVVPPSGDKHDYLSYSRYWWPNPDTPDGLPYVRRDGVVNRKLLAKGDRITIGAFCDDFESLSLAAYLIDIDRYSPKAIGLLRAWFIDPATRMNPHLEYGQGVPGKATGRGVGILDTRHFIRVIESVALLDSLGAVEANEMVALKSWFSEYLDWMLNSELGKHESNAMNNHGSWFAAQASCLALFVGQKELATQIIREVQRTKIPDSIQPDGSQPAELVRTKSLHYSLFNLSALSIVARVGESLDLDLWNNHSGKGSDLQHAFDYVTPYLESPEDWKHPELDDFRPSDRIKQSFLLAGMRYQSHSYAEAASNAPSRRQDRIYSPLLFKRYSGTPGVVHSGKNGYSLTISPSKRPARKPFELPSLEEYTPDRIAARKPQQFKGKASLAKASSFRLLGEAFYRDRGRDLRRRQGVEQARVILISGGAITLDRLVDQIDEEFATREDGAVLLRLPVLIGPGAKLVVEGDLTPEVRLSTDRGVFLANAGTLLCLNTTVTSWDEVLSQPTLFKKKTTFRPYMASYVRSKTYLAGCQVQHLGFAAPTAYGFSLSSHPERELGAPRDDWPTGAIVGSEFLGLYYGFYSFEARDVAIVGNRYVDNIVYGIDPHDRSTRLIIAKNTATGTVEKHGIIGSRDVNDSQIFDNLSYGNHGSGFMLDRNCSNNLVVNNRSHSNGQGIALYESPNNVLANNVIAFNEDAGIRVRNSAATRVYENTLVGNRDYAIQIGSKQLDDHKKRVKRGDHYRQEVSVDFFDNLVAGNRAIAKASTVQRLCISNIRRDADLEQIAKSLGIAAREITQDEANLFGSDLKQFLPQLRQAVQEDDLLLELTSSAPTKAE